MVAEKPSVGSDIARVLGARTRSEGCLRGEKYIVTWAIGHLVSLKEPDEIDARYKKWQSADLPILPEKIPLKVLPKTKQQFATVKALMNSEEVSDIICATDAGREGELIFRYIYIMAGCKKPFSRLWISSMTDAAIKAGFADIKPSSEYEGLYASARCRSEADWLVGMNASRAFTLRFNSLLSVGRVQTPTLALIVKRDREIAAFISEPYWELTVDYGGWKGTWFDPKTKQTRIESAERAKQLALKVKGKEATVTEYKREEKHIPPEKLYDLTTLQREANRRFGYNADRTLRIAQSLYETRKAITYPRTDSRFLPDDMKQKVAKTLSFLSEPYRAMVEKVQPIKVAYRIYNNAKISDHHAIIPTDKTIDPNALTNEERNIYDLVVKRLIANHYPDYIYSSQSVITQCEDEQFKTNEDTQISLGWKELYLDDSKQKQSEGKIPLLSVGDKIVIKKTDIQEKKTTPPSHYTDDTLLKAMEDAGKTIEDEELREKMKDSGLGTPATRAAIIQRLIAVGYVSRSKKNLLATEKGDKLIQVVPEEMSSAVTTGKWERALNNLSRINDPAMIGEKTGKFMASIRNYSIFLTDFARNKAKSVIFPKDEYRKTTAKGNSKWKTRSARSSGKQQKQ